MNKLKVHFTGVDFSSRTGPNTFAFRLADRMRKNGHFIADEDDYDIALVFIEPSTNINYKKPFVQRLDGIWSKPNEFKTKNTRIKKIYDHASGVVFQSEFNKKQIEKWFNHTKNKNIVINNGIEIIELNHIEPRLEEMRYQYDKIFVSSANWHPQKRLNENIRLFQHLRDKFYPNSCLIVMGNNPEYVADKDIFYTGSLSHEMCLQIYSMSDWMIHLGYADHCPNTVIEALSQYVAVICSDVGGTKEIVKNNGFMIQEKQKYNFELFDYDNPPMLDDFSDISILPEIDVDNKHIDIFDVCEKYENFLYEVLDRSK